ncbi:MAG: Nre family DNA repair protein [Methanosarcinales archaeon]
MLTNHTKKVIEKRVNQEPKKKILPSSGLTQNTRKPHNSLYIKEDVKKEYIEKASTFGASPPSIFIGQRGYPQINAGPLLLPERRGRTVASYESSTHWLEKSIQEIIEMRSSLIHSKITVNAKKPMSNRLIEKTQEIALSSDPVEIEVLFEKPPTLKLQFDDILTPLGPSGKIKRLNITENPIVPRKVDAVVSDTDMPATEAINELYRAKISEDHITRLLSTGLLGRRRRLVPTRWSITATDETIARELIKEIQDYQEVTEIEVYSGELLANHFEIILLPKPYAFELVEIWMSEKPWIGSDREDHRNRKKYSPLGGGYYAARLPVLEHLQAKQRRATAIAIREVRPDYWAPLGVWVVREAARNALKNPPKTFETLDQALRHIHRKIITPHREWQPQLRLLKEENQQRLIDYTE